MGGRFEVVENPMDGLFLLRRVKLGDARGHLSRLFCVDDLKLFGWSKPVAQINETLTREKGTIRGLHYQRPPFAEMKLVTCLKGMVHDAVVDLRAGSSSFAKVFETELSEDNDYALLVPEGFAHGFQTLTDNVQMIYMHSAPFSAEHEAGIDACDPVLNIQWPHGAGMRSKRDASLPPLSVDFKGIDL